ncbi:MAG: hypothetical protein AABZ09_03860, partial [Candidatus Binatota bacterium]
HDEPDRLALKKFMRGCLRSAGQKGKPEQEEKQAENISFHKSLPYQFFGGSVSRPSICFGEIFFVPSTT